MKLKDIIPSILFLFVCSCSTTKNNKNAAIAEHRPSVKCTENSPERRGEEGCTILANRLLVGPMTKSVYWYIDRFNSLETAMKAAGPNSVATEAHGSFWLLTVETNDQNHHNGGQHVVTIGPLDLPPGGQYTMRVLSSLLMPGSTTPIHIHSGPEVFYLIDGEQCIETQETGKHIRKGQTHIVPGGTIHRGRVIGSTARRALAIVLYDAANPVSRDLDNSTPIASCK